MGLGDWDPALVCGVCSFLPEPGAVGVLARTETALADILSLWVCVRRCCVVLHASSSAVHPLCRTRGGHLFGSHCGHGRVFCRRFLAQDPGLQKLRAGCERCRATAEECPL